MSHAIGSVLTFAVGVAVSPVPIIAVILMLFSAKAKVNGVAFLVGWVLALAVVCTVAYVVLDAGDPTTGSTSADTIAWGKVALGVVLLLLAGRNWRSRPAPGVEPPLPKWMAGVDSLTPGKSFGLGLALAGVNPKNLILTIGAASSLVVLSPTSSQATVAIVVFVLIASLTIAGPVVYYLVGGASAKAALDSLKDWLRTHNSAVMAVLFLVFGVDLIAKGLGR